MADNIEVAFDSPRQVALHDLHVVDVVLKLEIVRPDLLDNRPTLARMDKVKAGDIPDIDWLYQQRDTGVLQLRRREFQVCNEGFQQDVGLGVQWRYAREAVDPLTVQCDRVFDGLADALLKLPDAVRLAGVAPVSGTPVSGGQIVQHLGESVLFQLFSNPVLIEIVGKQIFDGLEPRFCRRLEAVEEVDLVEHHREICREFCHRLVPSNLSWNYLRRPGQRADAKL